MISITEQPSGEMVGEIDAQHHLHIMLPNSVPLGPGRILILLEEAGEDDAGKFWMQGIAREWEMELADEREDIYTLEDGEPPNAAR